MTWIWMLLKTGQNHRHLEWLPNLLPEWKSLNLRFETERKSKLQSWEQYQPSCQKFRQWMGDSLAGSVFSSSYQWFWATQRLETHSLDEFLAILISGSKFKDWRATHNLDGCSAILVSGSNPLENWRVTHVLDGCSVISQQWFWSVQKLEQLTYWMNVQSF